MEGIGGEKMSEPASVTEILEEKADQLRDEILEDKLINNGDVFERIHTKVKECVEIYQRIKNWKNA